MSELGGWWGGFELTAAVVGFDFPSVRVCVSGRFCSSSRATSSHQHGPTRGDVNCSFNP